MHVGDTIFIFCLALIIFGPKKLPEIGRQIGKLMVEFRRASNEFKMQIEDELRASEEVDRQKEITAAKTVTPGSVMLPTGEASSTTVPSIAPPSTGLPVNHTFPSSEPQSTWESPSSQSVSSWETPAVPSEAGDGANGDSSFNAGQNTASNGLATEDLGGATIAETALNTATSEATPFSAPLAHISDLEKAQASAHHD